MQICIGFVESQPQKVSKRTLLSCYQVVIIKWILNTLRNKSVITYYVRWQRGSGTIPLRCSAPCSNRSISPAGSSLLLWPMLGQTDRRTDTLPFHRPCSSLPQIGDLNPCHHKCIDLWNFRTKYWYKGAGIDYIMRQLHSLCYFHWTFNSYQGSWWCLAP